MKILKVLIILITTIWLCSCSLFQSAYDIADDYVEISWKPDKDKKQVIIDSVVIKFGSVYWKEKSNDSLTANIETDFNQDGYNIWTLKTIGLRYNEVRKQDTTIYIYGVKK